MYQQIINWLQHHELPCLFRRAFHFDCPGCGIQRSGIALLQGDLLTSFTLYPPLIPVLLFFAMLVINKFSGYRLSFIWIKTGIVAIVCMIALSYLYKIFTHHLYE